MMKLLPPADELQVLLSIRKYPAHVAMLGFETLILRKWPPFWTKPDMRKAAAVVVPFPAALVTMGRKRSPVAVMVGFAPIRLMFLSVHVTGVDHEQEPPGEYT